MQHQHYAFTVFGVSTNGRLCEEALSTLTRWEVNLTRHRRRNADLIGQPRREVRSAVGLLFASVMAAQAAAYVSDVDVWSRNAASDSILPGEGTSIASIYRRLLRRIAERVSQSFSGTSATSQDAARSHSTCCAATTTDRYAGEYAATQRPTRALIGVAADNVARTLRQHNT